MPEAFDGLASDRGDEVEVLVDVQHGESGEFGGRRDEQVGDRRGAVLATVGERGWISIARASIAGVMFSTGIDDTGGSPRVSR